jgi:hypothetical protein
MTKWNMTFDQSKKVIIRIMRESLISGGRRITIILTLEGMPFGYHTDS